ncbi:hypothetical protein PO909_008085 [Leuciscus waleckii]
MWTESDLYPGVPCLQSNAEPVNDKIYRMYHGTTEKAAEEIKVNGFQPSQDGMLGPWDVASTSAEILTRPADTRLKRHTRELLLE